MTKKKRGHPDVEEILSRPWCYYCERDFDDLKILINHQKAKHFKCERCGRRLNTAGGLSVHMSQVHKENLSAVDNALPNRAGLDIEIFGMEGIPEDIVQQHTQRVLTNFHQAEAERRAASGNAAGSTGPGGQTKKPKFESPSELKKRLADHKAKLAAEHANGSSSGGGTPLGAGQAQPHAMLQIPNTFQAGSPQYPPYQQPFNGPPVNGPFSQPQAFTQGPVQAPPYQQPQPYGQAPSQAPPPFQQPPTGYPQPSFSPPPFQNQSPYGNQPFSAPVMQNGLPPFPGPPINGPPRSFGVNSPAQSFQQQHNAPPRLHTPPQSNSFPPRPPSLPPAPGLPQRPAFGAPQVNAFQMQQMHQGQISGLPNPPPSGNQSFQKHDLSQTVVQQQPQPSAAQPDFASQEDPNATSLDDLISGASKEAEANQSVQPDTFTAPQAVEVIAEEKAPKKEKDKNKPSKLVYSDNELSPEEKMARMPRYAFTPEMKAAMA